MKLTIINGSTRNGSTRHCAQLICDELSRYDHIETAEFFLPRNMPHFCNGCFSCFQNGEHTCPHTASVSPIAEALAEADLIIITSSVYAMDVTGQLKALLDHLCFMWLTHRPNPKMFNKIGLTVSTTAGAGLSHTAKTIKYSLKFWGVKRIFSYKKAVAASAWNGVSEANMARIKKQAAALAKKIAKAVKNADALPSPFFRGFMFFIVKSMMKKNFCIPYDKSYWESRGWLSGGKPF